MFCIARPLWIAPFFFKSVSEQKQIQFLDVKSNRQVSTSPIVKVGFGESLVWRLRGMMSSWGPPVVVIARQNQCAMVWRFHRDIMIHFLLKTHIIMSWRLVFLTSPVQDQTIHERWELERSPNLIFTSFHMQRCAQFRNGPRGPLGFKHLYCVKLDVFSVQGI